MKKPNKTLRMLGVGRMTVKYNAHALTMFAVFWSFPSALVIMMLILGYQDRRSGFDAPRASIVGVCAALFVLGIHLWSIIAAIYYWRTERKRKVTVLHTRGEISAGL